MSPLCKEFGIFRKTGYKIYDRYKECGLEGLNDRSRRPYRHANQLPFQVERSILNIKKEFPNFGAPKIREKLIRQFDLKHIPAKSTIHAVLDRNGLVKRNSRRRRWHGYKAQGTELSNPTICNDLWCADYKGEFLLGNKQYCYPLTITDYNARYLLACDSLESTKESFAFTIFERVFKEFGLPRTIRTDNGTPFSSANALHGLSKLSVWWLRLGIDIERIKPGNPQQNGRHERMHLTLKKETTKPAKFNHLQQQERFDEFIDYYNNKRPHQAINMKYPAEIYQPSVRQYNGLPEVDYPYHDRTVTVTHCGRICIKKRKINLSQALSGQNIGIKEIDDKICLVTFMNYDLGFFDEELCRVEPTKNPFIKSIF